MAWQLPQVGVGAGAGAGAGVGVGAGVGAGAGAPPRAVAMASSSAALRDERKLMPPVLPVMAVWMRVTVVPRLPEVASAP